jgi:hypothetical protein
LEDGVEVEIMWIPSHVGLEGNEIVDERARHAALNGVVFDGPLPPMDFQGLARSLRVRKIQIINGKNHTLSLACLRITGGMRSTPTSALEVMLILPPLHFVHETRGQTNG